MTDTPDLTGFTLMIIFAMVCIVPLIRPYDKKKRLLFRFLAVFLAVAIYLAVLIPKLKTLPPTDQSIVYITETGTRYHDGSCGELWSSKIPITLKEAIENGYRECYNCATPAYRSDEIRITFTDLYPSVSTENIGIVLFVIILYVVFFCRGLFFV